MAAERFPVEKGHVMMFARSVGDPNKVYYDEEYAAKTEVGHVIAPPTFVQASAQFDPNYGLRPKPGQPDYPCDRSPLERDVKAGDNDITIELGRRKR